MAVELGDLADELLLMIAANLDVPSAGAFRQASRRTNRIGGDRAAVSAQSARSLQAVRDRTDRISRANVWAGFRHRRRNWHPSLRNDWTLSGAPIQVPGRAAALEDRYYGLTDRIEAASRDGILNPVTRTDPVLLIGWPGSELDPIEVDAPAIEPEYVYTGRRAQPY